LLLTLFPLTGDFQKWFRSHKPDSVSRERDDYHFSRTRSRELARDSCKHGQRVRHTRGYWTGRPAAYFVLHRIGFFVPPPLQANAVGSYSTFSLWPSRRRRRDGYLFSVTLSITAAWPAMPRLEGRVKHRCFTRPLSAGILPDGVRTFLSKLNERGRLPASWDQRTRSDSLAPKPQRCWKKFFIEASGL